MNNIGAVIAWKFDNQSGMMTVDGVITKFPETTGVTLIDGIPSAEDQATWSAEYEAYLAETAYSRNRKAEYPSIGDQLDMMMKDMRDGTTTHQTACEAVKAKYPKPE